MSNNHAAFKIVSLIQAIVGIAAVALGVTLFAGLGAATGSIGVLGMRFDTMLWKTVCGLLFDLGGVISIISGIIGLRGAGNQDKLGSHMLISVLAIVAGVVAAFMSAAESDLLAMIVAVGVVAFNIAGIVLDHMARRDLERDYHSKIALH